MNVAPSTEARVEVSSLDSSDRLPAKLFREMLRIRTFEEALLDRFRSGEVRGTTHTSIGQEATACALMQHLVPADFVFSNHRCHGHFLARGGSMRRLLWEIMGHEGGVCDGIGGSQHLCDGRFFSNGIQGGIVPVACGLALSQKLLNEDAISVCFMGDGTLGEGVVYESFNLASVFEVPVLFIIEANGIAQTTRTSDALSGSIPARLEAFGIRTCETTEKDAMRLVEALAYSVEEVRTSRKPLCHIVHLPRLGPHSKGDDTRDEEELRMLRIDDPLETLRREISQQAIEQIEHEVRSEVDALFAEAIQAHRSETRHSNHAPMQDDEMIVSPSSLATEAVTAGGLTGVEFLRTALDAVLMQYPETLVIGEDNLDPYGGAFKATRGLQSKYSDRFFSTPISEAGIVGLANGLALAGLRPIVEIMFGDFITLAADQIVNHAAKFHGMYNRQVDCPLIIRTPMGGYRGYGPTHSQSLEKLFLGVPGLIVTAASPYHDLTHLWLRMLEQRHPILHLENKTSYGRSVPSRKGNRIGNLECEASSAAFPTIRLSLAGHLARKAQVVILTYGGLSMTAAEAIKAAFEEDEIIVSVAVFSLLSPLPIDELEWAVGSAPAFITFEEGTVRGGWGAEITAALLTRHKLQARRIGAQQSVIPSAEIGEHNVLPDLEELMGSIRLLRS